MSTTELKGTIILATDTSAKVGIGKTQPETTLDVAGSMNVTGGTLPANTKTDPPVNYTGTNLISQFTFTSSTNGESVTSITSGVNTGGRRFTSTVSGYSRIATDIGILTNVKYKVLFTTQATTDDTYVRLVTAGGSYMTVVGLIEKNVTKTYTHYFSGPADTIMYIELYGSGTIARTIDIKYLSFDPFYGTTIQGGLNTDIIGTNRIRLNYTKLPTSSPQFNIDHIGYTIQETITLGTLISGNNLAFTTSIYPTTGVWLVSYSLRAVSDPTATLTVTGYHTFIIFPVDNIPSISYGQNLASGNFSFNSLGYSGSGVLICNGSEGYNVQFYVNYSGGTFKLTKGNENSASIIQRTRIA